MLDESIKPRFCVDASFVLAFLLPDEKIEIVEETFKNFLSHQITLISTFLLPFEVGNSIKMALTRKRVTKQVATTAIKDFLQMEIALQEVNIYKAFQIANKRGLTVYDASYFTLAQEQKVPLLTLDEKLENLPRRKTN